MANGKTFIVSALSGIAAGRAANRLMKSQFDKEGLLMTAGRWVASVTVGTAIAGGTVHLIDKVTCGVKDLVDEISSMLGGNDKDTEDVVRFDEEEEKESKDYGEVKEDDK